MTTVTIATVLLFISTVTTGIPVNVHPTNSMALDAGISPAKSTVSLTDTQVQTQGDGRTSIEKALSQIMEKINGNTLLSKSGEN